MIFRLTMPEDLKPKFFKYGGIYQRWDNSKPEAEMQVIIFGM